jgi:hypothetical protein
MTDLSPAAQAVLNAYRTLYAETLRPGPFVDNWQEVCAAAAIRAASARMMNLVGDIYHPKYLEGIEASSDFLDQIATELEALPND